jgi:methyl-accepting chemotaxis protein
MNAEWPLTDSSSLQAALDSIQANIFIADRDFKLIYMNPKAEQTLKNLENAIFEVFGVRVEDFIGESIHRFHRDPDRVEKILRDPMALPHEAIFQFGDIHLRSSINKIVGPEGEIRAYIVNWEDVSEKTRLLERMSGKNESDLDIAKLIIELKNIEAKG